MDLFSFQLLLVLLSFFRSHARRILLPDGPVDAALGGDVTLKTLLDKIDLFYLGLRWDFSGRIHVADMSRDKGLVVTERYRGRASVSSSSGHLTLRSLRMEDSGNYTITLLSTNGVTAEYVELRVLEPISFTKITRSTATHIAGEGSVRLSCQAAVGLVETRTWLKDGKPLSKSSRLVFSRDMSSVTMDPLQKEDGGEYTCQLTNPVSVDEASYNMVVNFGPEPATVTGPDTVEVNDHVTLTCSAASVPPATFTWKFNGAATDVNTAQFTVEKVGFRNGGTYTCEAHNSITGKMTTDQHMLSVTVYFVSLVVCVVVIVLLSTVFLLLLFKQLKNHKFAVISRRNKPFSVCHEMKRTSSDCTCGPYTIYQDQDQDHVYSTFPDTQH